MAYWISWYTDVEPELNEGDMVWQTGWDGNDRAIYCAKIDAISEDDAWHKIGLWCWDYERRFAQEVDSDWTPNSTRFPIKVNT